MIPAFKHDIRNGCFTFIESRASKKALEKVPCLKKLREKLRKFAKKANKSAKFAYAISNEHKAKGVTEKTLNQEVKMRFTSTHTMMRSFLNNPNELLDAEIDANAADNKIQAINEAIVLAKFKKPDIDSMKITQKKCQYYDEIDSSLGFTRRRNNSPWQRELLHRFQHTSV